MDLFLRSFIGGGFIGFVLVGFVALAIVGVAIGLSLVVAAAIVSVLDGRK